MLRFRGASIIAGKAVGIFDDMKKTAREHVKVLKDYKPTLICILNMKNL